MGRKKKSRAEVSQVLTFCRDIYGVQERIPAKGRLTFFFALESSALQKKQPILCLACADSIFLLQRVACRRAFLPLPRKRVCQVFFIVAGKTKRRLPPTKTKTTAANHRNCLRSPPRRSNVQEKEGHSKFGRLQKSRRSLFCSLLEGSPARAHSCKIGVHTWAFA